MQNAIKIGMWATMLAAGMTCGSTAQAADPPAVPCDENMLYATQRTMETVDGVGFNVYFWVCTESGWEMYGATYCDLLGNCAET